MSEKKNNILTPEEDYRLGYMPAVHRIGRTIMVIALILCFLPWAYYRVSCQCCRDSGELRRR